MKHIVNNNNPLNDSYNTNLGVIRVWCNGVLDKLEKHFETIKKEK